MPSYLHPGVYVEEIPSGSKPIEGVGTSTAAFVGYATKGPIGEPTLISKWDEYDRIYGGVRNLQTSAQGDSMGLSVSAFFQNPQPAADGWGGRPGVSIGYYPLRYRSSCPLSEGEPLVKNPESPTIFDTMQPEILSRGDGRARVRFPLNPAHMIPSGRLQGGMRWRGQRLRLGDFYARFGHGLTLSLRRVDPLGLDTALRGGRLDLALGPVRVTALGGTANPQNLDPIVMRVVEQHDDLIAGAQVEVGGPAAWIAPYGLFVRAPGAASTGDDMRWILGGAAGFLDLGAFRLAAEGAAGVVPGNHPEDRGLNAEVAGKGRGSKRHPVTSVLLGRGAGTATSRAGGRGRREGHSFYLRRSSRVNDYPVAGRLGAERVGLGRRSGHR